MPTSAAERSLAARSAAHRKWAKTASSAERSAATAAARSAFDERFVAEVDPDGRLTPDELARAVENARRAYFSDIRRKGMRAQRRRAEIAAELAEINAAAADAAELAEVDGAVGAA